MTPEFPPNNPRAELEARLTTFILGELPAHDAAALRQIIDDDFELAALYDRLTAAHKLVREAAANPAEPAHEAAAPLRLSEARRQKLLAQFKTVAPMEFAPENKPAKGFRLIELVAVIAIVGILAGLMLPALSSSKHAFLSETPSRLAVASPRESAAAPSAVRNYTMTLPSAPGQAEVASSGAEVSQQIARDLTVISANDVVTRSAPPAKTTIALPPMGNSSGNEVELTWETQDGSTRLPNQISGSSKTLTPPGYVDTSINWNSGDGNGRTPQPAATVGSVDANPQGTSETKTFALKNADPKEVANLMSSLFPENSTVTANESGGSMTITADKEQMAQINSIVGSLDQDSLRKQQVHYYDLNSADAQDVQRALQDLFPSNNSGTRSLQNATTFGGAGTNFYAGDTGYRFGYFGHTAQNVDATNFVATGLYELGLSTNNSTVQVGDPEWIGFLEHPDQRHSASNSFLSRGAFVAIPIPQDGLDANSIHNQAKVQPKPPISTSGSLRGFYDDAYNTDVDSIHNQAHGIATLQNNGSLDDSFQPGQKPPVYVPYKPNSGFRFYQDLNGNGTYDTNGIVTAQSAETTPQDNVTLTFDDANNYTKYRQLTPFSNSASPELAATSADFAQPNYVMTNGVVDVLTAPEVTTESGRTAKLESSGVTKIESPRAAESRGSSMRKEPAFRPDNGQNFTYAVVDGKLVAVPAPNNDFHFGTVPYVTGTYFGGINGAAEPPEPVAKAKFPRAEESDSTFSGVGSINNGVVLNPKPVFGTPPIIGGSFGSVQSGVNGSTARQPVGIDSSPKMEFASDVEQRSGKFEPLPNALSNSNQGADTNVETVNVVGYINLNLTNGVNLIADQVASENAGKKQGVSSVVTTSTNDPFFSTGQRTSGFNDRLKALGLKPAAGRSEPIIHAGEIDFAGVPPGQFTNGSVYPNSTMLGDVTVSVDPETKRVFYITDPETSNAVAEIMRHLDTNSAAGRTSLPLIVPTNYAADNGGHVPAKYAKASDISGILKTLGANKTNGSHSQAYREKQAELEQLVATRTVLTANLAQQTNGKKAPPVMTTEMIEPASAAAPASRTMSRMGSPLSSRTARLKLERDDSEIGSIGGAPYPATYDPHFIQTEFEVIQSEKILDQVIDKLNLNEIWAKKAGHDGPLKTATTRSLLKNRLSISPESNTNLIDIKVTSRDAAEAARIANTIAEVYQDYRVKRWHEMRDNPGDATKREVTEQDQKIVQARKELAQLESQKAEADAPLTKPAAPPPVPQPEVSTAENAFSTFSLNISDVSLKLAAASLEKGQMPDASTIRSEEFINAFDYRDPEPAPGAPIGFAWERAQYPFAHNRDLLRFAVKTAATGRDPGRPLNIVLLLDKSGSMERADRVRIIHEALRVLATQLQPQDKISVVTFARVARLWVDGLSGSQAAQVANGLDQLTPEGGTNLEEAMRLAYETARRHYMPNGVNRVVLLTDGAANLGNVDPDALKVKAEEHRKEGIALDCFGVGWEGYNDDLLEVLSRNGGGRYGFINTPEEAATDFVGQLAGALNVAAYDVKVQVEFNPKRVTNWRQIGYAKHQLTKEQFRDNTVKAAQIAAAESGNGLYAIEVNPNGEGPVATVRVRYRVPGTEDYPEHEYEVPYTGGVLPLEQSSPAMRLIGSASAFSEWLASSPFAGEVTTDKLLGLMSGVPETYGADQRPKKLEWMIRQAKSLEGK